MSNRLYLLKIRLNDIEPAIWRRFVVPANIPLDLLHSVIQAVMGWDSSHLYEFTFWKNRYSKDPSIIFENEFFSNEHSLEDLAKRKGYKFDYQYDFIDSWWHKITVEDINYCNYELESEIICLAGERACPPEDIGGVWGYDIFCATLKNPNYERREEEFMQRFNGKYDCEHFDLATVNKRLAKINHAYQNNMGREQQALLVCIAVQSRIGQVEYLGQKLIEWGVPIVQPVGGHAVYLDAKAFYPQLKQDQFPAQTLAAELYVDSGVRAMERGIVSAGRNKVTGDHYYPKLELVRLTIPRRVYTQSHMDVTAESVLSVWQQRKKVRGLKMVHEPKYLRFFQARFEKL